MDELINTRGRGSLGTPTNSPISDVNTMARTQNKPSAPQGMAADPVSGSTKSLTQVERDFIYEIHQARNLDRSPLSLSQLQRLRTENAQLQAQAAAEFGAGSKTALYYQEIVAAYDEMIADAKSPLGSAINGLQSVLADPKATEKERSEKVATTIGIMRQVELLGQDDKDPQIAEATALIVELIKVDTKEKTAALEVLVNKEKSSSGSVSEDQFKTLIAKLMGDVRQEELMGIEEDDKDEKESGPSKAMGLVIDSLNLVADRRVATLKDVVAQEQRFPGSVSDQQFQRLVQAVIGDGRQKLLLGLSNSAVSDMETVTDVMKIFLERRRAALAALFKKQGAPGSRVTAAQVDQAMADYEAAKTQAMQWGVAVVNAPDIPDQKFQAEQRPGPQ